MSEPAHLARKVGQDKYSWPGGYELFAVTDDGAVLCHTCCETEYQRICEAIPRDGFYVTGIDSAEMDEDLICDHCGRTIHGLN